MTGLKETKATLTHRIDGSAYVELPPDVSGVPYHFTLNNRDGWWVVISEEVTLPFYSDTVPEGHLPSLVELKGGRVSFSYVPPGTTTVRLRYYRVAWEERVRRGHGAPHHSEEDTV